MSNKTEYLKSIEAALAGHKVTAYSINMNIHTAPTIVNGLPMIKTNGKKTLLIEVELEQKQNGR